MLKKQWKMQYNRVAWGALLRYGAAFLQLELCHQGLFTMDQCLTLSLPVVWGIHLSSFC